jgi:hypothetical protein
MTFYEFHLLRQIRGFKMFRVGLTIMPSGPCLTWTLADVCQWSWKYFGSESENDKGFQRQISLLALGVDNIGESLSLQCWQVLLVWSVLLHEYNIP